MLFHVNKTAKSRKRRISLVPMIPRRFTSLKKINKEPCERAVLCTSDQLWKKASLTIEAAVVVPLFLLAMFTLICIVDLCRIHVIEQAKIGNKAKQLGTCAYLTKEYMEDPYVDLYEVYSYKLPITLIPGYQIDVALRGRVHAWVGRTGQECEADKNKIAEEMVYVTDHQAVYHTDSGCSHLQLSVYAVDSTRLSNYDFCKKCCGSTEVTTYYVTENGDCCHASRSCSGLTRNVRLVFKSEAAGLPCCSRCQGG